MALNLNSTNATVNEILYTFKIEGIDAKTWSFTEAQAQRVIDFMNSLNNTAVSAPEASVTEASAPTPYEKQANAAVRATTSDMKCKWEVEELTTPGGDKFYRIKDGIFTAGKWRQSKFDPNKEYRVETNLEAHKLALDKVKALKNIQKVEMSGGWFAYGFKTKATATKALKSLPECIQAVEICSYIAEHGAIKGKSHTRDKIA